MACSPWATRVASCARSRSDRVRSGVASPPDAPPLHDGWTCRDRAGAAWRRIAAPRYAVAARAVRRAPQPASVPPTRLANQPGVHAGDAAATPGARAPAGGNALRRQVDHRRGDRARRDAGRAIDAERLVRERSARPAALAAGGGVRAGGTLGRARAAGLPPRLAALGAVLDHHQRAPDGARGDARPRGLRGQRAAGPARPCPAPGVGAHDVDDPAFRPGAGRGHHHQLRGGPRGVRAVADRAPGGGARPGLRRRSPLQRAELRAHLRPNAGAARARLRAPDRRQRGERQGSQDSPGSTPS